MGLYNTMWSSLTNAIWRHTRLLAWSVPVHSLRFAVNPRLSIIQFSDVRRRNMSESPILNLIGSTTLGDCVAQIGAQLFAFAAITISMGLKEISDLYRRLEQP